ncbi:MAG TPA: glutathione S-transferase family protein [Rhodanobacteraceae bacterium]|nr:glutathione S-transferase family protein [Rhodanobacteraceae bacterium]
MAPIRSNKMKAFTFASAAGLYPRAGHSMACCWANYTPGPERRLGRRVDLPARHPSKPGEVLESPDEDTKMTKIKVYGVLPTRVLRVLWLLDELGLEYEWIPTEPFSEETRSPAFRALSPTGKVPVLVDGDVVLTESSAIQLYLAEKYPAARLIPEDIAQRAQMYRWIFFLVTEIEQPLWRIARNTVIYPEEERLSGDVATATRECKEMAAVLEKHMRGREYLVGDRLSVADLNAAYTLDWAREAEMLGDAPVLGAYVERMYARSKAPPTIESVFAAQRAE